jgi:hypothetical protein
LIFSGLPGVISQNTELLITTGVTTSNPANECNAIAKKKPHNRRISKDI